MKRIAVTGLTGQVVSSLIERAPTGVEMLALGRPRFDLSSRDMVLASLRNVRCDAIINAAAYTQVDKAESEPEVAMRINGVGAGFVAETAAELKTPLLHLSSDYVFDGTLDRPYREDDAPSPACAYGRSKLEGERQIAARCENCVILRTGWVYSPFGTNFVKTMLNLGETRDEIGVVADQIGNPTSALDIADALLAIAERLVDDSDARLRGVFHLTGQGEASWADMAEAVFASAEARGRKPVRVKRIATKDYPTPARRPLNSRLDNAKLQTSYGITLPQWRQSLDPCVRRLIEAK